MKNYVYIAAQKSKRIKLIVKKKKKKLTLNSFFFLSLSLSHFFSLSLCSELFFIVMFKPFMMDVYKKKDLYIKSCPNVFFFNDQEPKS